MPPVGIFNGSAELAEKAGKVLQAIMASPGGCNVLFQAGCYNAVGNLLKDKILPLSAVVIIGYLFRGEGAQDRQLLTLARMFLGLGFLQYVLDRIEGMLHYRLYSPLQESTV